MKIGVAFGAYTSSTASYFIVNYITHNGRASVVLDDSRACATVDFGLMSIPDIWKLHLIW